MILLKATKIVFIALFTCCNLTSQTLIDSVKENRKRIVATSVIVGGGVGSMATLYGVWYRKETKVAFHAFNDGQLWLQMDKAGHAYTAYQLSSLSNGLLRWAGCSPKKATWWSGGISLAYQSTLEMFDGISSDWGFSWYDMSANFIGTSLFTMQELLWKEQRFLPKFSYHPTPFASLRPEVLGSSFFERVLKDYNGQTYWLSFNPFQFSQASCFPKWLCLSIGYSADAKLKGDNELYTDFKGATHYAYREWLFSVDIDFSKLPAKNTTLKKVLKQFNYIKFPFPTLLFRKGVVYGIPIYF
jgi:hypothetical protein